MVGVMLEILETRRDDAISSGGANRESTLHEMAAEPSPLSFNCKAVISSNSSFTFLVSGTKGHEVPRFQI